MERELWTNSRSRCFLACQCEHDYRYVRGYSPVSDKLSLRFGTLVHVGLEAWWKASKSTRLESSISAFRAALPTDFDPYEAAKAEAMLIGYDTRWGDEEFETLAVECEFRVPLVGPSGERCETFDRAGKIDAIVRHCRTGRVVGVEHKTSGVDIEPGSDYWKTLRIDGQSSTYFDGALSLGYELHAMVYDMLAKPKIKPLKATPEELRQYTKPTKKEPIPRLYANQRASDETVGEYFERCAKSIAEDPTGYYARVEIVRLESEMMQHRAEQFSLAEFATEAKRVGFAPRNPGACRRYNSLCDFLPVCAGEASLEDRRLYQLSTTKHRELSQEVQQ